MMQLAGIISDANNLANQLKTLLIVGVLGCMYLVSVAVIWGQTKSVLKAAVAALGGAVVMALVVNMTALRDKVGEDIKSGSSSAHAPAQVVDRLGAPKDAS
ncbi:hypothetical protein ACFXPZ_17990 [Streptomyces sp. NPDC059101]|uniref:hypothetical protein n=1 Tax=Streptomyces sp. NPDC059101 TaxID=3346728 RepID=UPI0036A11CED